MADCENIGGCSFFLKYQGAKQLVCQGLMNKYCKGEHQADCKRKEYKKAHGVGPDAEMMPNGARISA
jgi:hypothetical protein